MNQAIANAKDEHNEKERDMIFDENVNSDRTEQKEKPKRTKKVKINQDDIPEPVVLEHTFQDLLTVRMLVRTREDFMGMRKKMDNRLGRKKNGEQQNVDERAFREDDITMFASISEACTTQEEFTKKMLGKVLKRFPIYSQYLLNVKGVGEISSGWMLAEFDIHKADTVSKMWQFAGLNPSEVRGTKDMLKSVYKPEMGKIVQEYTTFNEDVHVRVLTDTMVRGDKLTAGFTAPFNKNLRTALVGVMADGFIKCQNMYALNFYYPYKARLAQEENTVLHCGKMVAWKDVSDGHRDRSAKRYMIKMFLKDLYVAWRMIEGLPVRPSYQEEYLGHIHKDKYATTVYEGIDYETLADEADMEDAEIFKE